MTLLFRSIFCVGIAAFFLYAYIHKHNQLTSIQMKVPLLQKQLKLIEDEIALLQFEKEKFENPVHLMELARQPQFGHLKHPLMTDIIEITVPAGSTYE